MLDDPGTCPNCSTEQAWVNGRCRECYTAEDHCPNCGGDWVLGGLAGCYICGTSTLAALVGQPAAEHTFSVPCELCKGSALWCDLCESMFESSMRAERAELAERAKLAERARPSEGQS